MPSGHSHNRVNGFLLVAALGGALALGAPLEAGASLAAGVALGFVINPDLDLDGGSIAMHNVRRTIGRPAAWLWRALWWPYSKLIEHRSKWSHRPLLGTSLRVAYLALLLFPLTSRAWAWVNPWLFGLAFAGLCLSDFVHWALDSTTTG